MSQYKNWKVKTDYWKKQKILKWKVPLKVNLWLFLSLLEFENVRAIQRLFHFLIFVLVLNLFADERCVGFTFIILDVSFHRHVHFIWSHQFCCCYPSRSIRPVFFSRFNHSNGLSTFIIRFGPKGTVKSLFEKGVSRRRKKIAMHG